MHQYSELVRRLGSSRFNYWFGYVANGAWVAWFVSRALPGGACPQPWPALIGYAAAGLLLWTLLEYGLHRYVYHVWPSFLSHGHGLHHAAPRALIGVPWWLTSAALYGLYALLTGALPEGPVGLVMGFCWAGYIAYCLLHHGSHHWSMRSPYLRNMKRLHQLHHAYPAYNWGFTTSLWDVVFRTYLPAAPGRTRAAQPNGSTRPKLGRSVPAGWEATGQQSAQAPTAWAGAEGQPAEALRAAQTH